MSKLKQILIGTVLFCFITVVAVTAMAQEVTGTPGSPSATTTLDGRYLPNPPEPFGGIINLDAFNSKPYWPPTVVPPKDAPNVLLILTGHRALSEV